MSRYFRELCSFTNYNLRKKLDESGQSERQMGFITGFFKNECKFAPLSIQNHGLLKDLLALHDRIYLTPFNFRLPQIFSPRGAKIKGSELIPF